MDYTLVSGTHLAFFWSMTLTRFPNFPNPISIHVELAFTFTYIIENVSTCLNMIFYANYIEIILKKIAKKCVFYAIFHKLIRFPLVTKYTSDEVVCLGVTVSQVL